MNLESLKQRVHQSQAYQWQGESIYLRKIGAADGIVMLEKIKALSGETLNQERDRNETLDYYAFAVSKSMADAQGELTLDSDDGLSLLKQMNFNELCELGEIVLKHSGFWASEKKTSQTPNCLDSDSVPTSSGPTPTTSTLS